MQTPADEAGVCVTTISTVFGKTMQIVPNAHAQHKQLRLEAIRAFRNYQPADTAVVLFDIQSHVSIDGHEPSLDEAKRLYLRWFGTAGRVTSLSSARSPR